MSLHQFLTVQNLPVSIEAAWNFFSNPANLQKITPPKMSFKIRSKIDRPSTYAGQIIEYKVSPVFSIPMTWVTEITHVCEPFYFVDEQRKGPYKFWHHQHHFEKIDGGTKMTDIVSYEIPLGPIGDLINTLYIHQQVKNIFTHRSKVLNQLFGTIENKRN